MKIFNSTRKTPISDDARVRDTAKGRRQGLIDSPKMDIVLDVGRDSRILSMIHMFKMGYCIDVIWVCESMKAVDVRVAIAPSRLSDPSSWRLYMPKRPARYVIELGSGSAENTMEGDRIEFE